MPADDTATRECTYAGGVTETPEIEIAVESPAGTLRVEGFALGPFATNCYVVWVVGVEGGQGGRGCWIVDAGFDPGRLIGRVRELGLTPTDIILTHAHCDHIGGLGEVLDAFPGTPVHLHAAESDWPGNPDLNLSGGYGVPVTTPPADRTLEDGQELALDGLIWRVLHTPGHSPGGVTLYQADSGIALVGDTLFNRSIGRFDFPTSDQDALFASIREKLYTLPDETRALPGHGPATTIGEEKQFNPFVRP